MKKNISNSLSQSLQKERNHIKKLDLKKFDLADKILSAKNISKTKTKRDTFTIPENDYNIIDQCKKRFLKQEIIVTKSEIIRIGLKLLQDLSNEDLKKSYTLIDKIKIGRPKNI